MFQTLNPEELKSVREKYLKEDENGNVTKLAYSTLIDDVFIKMVK